VILEYKRASNENVVSQGLFYLDWLMDHRKDFQWLVLKKLGKEDAEAVDWSAPRLMQLLPCVQGCPKSIRRCRSFKLARMPPPDGDGEKKLETDPTMHAKPEGP
jgi:hypothetical protein